MVLKMTNKFWLSNKFLPKSCQLKILYCFMNSFIFVCQLEMVRSKLQNESGGRIKALRLRHFLDWPGALDSRIASTQCITRRCRNPQSTDSSIALCGLRIYCIAVLYTASPWYIPSLSPSFVYHGDAAIHVAQSTNSVDAMHELEDCVVAVVHIGMAQSERFYATPRECHVKNNFRNIYCLEILYSQVMERMIHSYKIREVNIHCYNKISQIRLCMCIFQWKVEASTTSFFFL